MIPFTNSDTGLRDYRAAAWREVPTARWPWLVVLVLLIGSLIALVLGVGR